MDWLRLYTNVLDNPKLQRLSGEHFKFVVNLWCLARIHNGTLPDVSDVAFRLRCTETQAADLIEELIVKRILDRTPNGIIPHDWTEHQYSSDSSTKRVRNHRERKKIESETLMKRSSNVIEQNRTEQKQIRTEHNQNGANGAHKPPMMPPISQSEYPLTIAEIRKHDAAVDDIFVLRLVQQATQACLSHSKFPQDKVAKATTDKAICAACKESYATGPANHKTGLLLSRVPPILITWGLEK